MHSANVAEDACTILVVDDEPRIVEVVGNMLRAAGYKVMQAAGPAQALRIASWASIDLVVSDINMRDLDGVQLASHLRRLAPGLPILFMSGGANQEAPPHTIQKPIHMPELHTRVAEALRIRAKA